MNSVQSDSLSEEVFLSEVAPLFEKTKTELLLLLEDDREWSSFLSSTHLVYIDNSATDNNSHFYLTHEADSNLYLRDTPPIHQDHRGFSSQNITEGYVKIPLIDCLRNAFVEELISRATPEQLAEYFRQLLESDYRSVGYIEHRDYIRLWVFSPQFSEERPLFGITAYRTNMIIPIAEELDANQIEDTTAHNKKVVLINRKNTETFSNFDHVLSIRHLTTHFIVNFVLGIPLYRQILAKDYSRVFEIVDLLRTTGYSETYELKRQLVSLDLSDGKAFESYLDRFLHTCFEAHFEDIDIRQQVPNKGRLRIRDFVIVNSGSNAPFLQSLKNKGVDFLLFDAKNYAGELSTRDFDTFKEYLQENQYFGNFGIILSRNGASDNAKESIFRRLPQGIRVIVVDETDLLSMLDRIDSGRSAVDVLENKYNELLLQL